MTPQRRFFSHSASLFMLAMIVLAACAPAPTPTLAPTDTPLPTAAPTVAPTTVPTETQAVVPITAATAPAAPVAALALAKSDTLGAFLADGSGHTLYLFTKDTKNTSNCYDKCAQAWPPLLTSDKPTLGAGLDAALVGTTQRKDGSTQITYNGWPLYYYQADQKSGDVSGQGVGKVWWVISGEGWAVKPAALQLGTDPKLGKFLTDGNGFTLYLFTKDTKDTTTCYGKCETAWPPLLETGKPTLGDGVDAALVGAIQRKDGSMQVTYAGMPLYYFAPDQKAGDVTGQGVGKVWYVIGADGKAIQ